MGADTYRIKDDIQRCAFYIENYNKSITLYIKENILVVHQWKLNCIILGLFKYCMYQGVPHPLPGFTYKKLHAMCAYLSVTGKLLRAVILHVFIYALQNIYCNI